MFKQALTNLPLADKEASDFFSSIHADTFEGDESFRATLRMILHNRMLEGESISVKTLIDSKNDRTSTKLEIHIRNSSLTVQNYLRYDTVYVIALKGYSDEDIQLIEDSAKSVLSAYQFHTPVSHYLSQRKCKASVYINEPERRTVVLFKNMNQQSWHRMQSSIPKLMPWLFKSRLVEYEKELLKSLTIADSGKYLELISAYAKKFNYHEDKITRLLNGFGMKHERQRLESLKNERDANHVKFESLQNDIATCIAKDQSLQVSIMGVETLLEQGDGSGLVDYFIYNKSLHLQDVGSDYFTFMVTTYLDYFDQSVFDKFFANPKSYFYEKTNGLAKDDESFKNLLLALYGSDFVIRVRVCAEFRLSLLGTLSPIRSSARINNFPHWLPHPHIDSCACLGSNTAVINKLMMERKYLEAIEQAISATKNINFADSAIAPKLVQSIRTGTQKFLELPDGSVVSPVMATKWLNSNEGGD